MSISLTQWAIKHHVSAQALHELQALFGLHGDHVMPAKAKGDDESAVQSVVRLEAARKGSYLFRNNVGALLDERGVPVRYGLANDSKQLNEHIKSGDLIGWQSVLIEQHHVGTLIAQFISRECKRVGWRYSGTPRERAQLNWAELVVAHGGNAMFVTGEGSL